MIRINNIEYSGNLVPTREENKLDVMLYVVTTITDLSIAMNDVSEVIDIDASGAETVYKVQSAVSIKKFNDSVYMVEFSTKKSVLKDINDTIDEILLMLLEE